MSIAELNAQQAREKLGEKQKTLGQVFDQAKVTGDSGKKQYDFNKVTVFGADVKGSIAVAEKVAQLTAEADELAQHAETLEAAEKAALQWDSREKGLRRVPHPGGGGGRDDERRGQIKSLGALIREEKSYLAYAQRGAIGGIDLSFPDLLPSDMLALGAQYDTIGSKALMTTSAGYAPEVIRQPGYVEAATRPIQLLDLIPMFSTDQSAIAYMEETTRAHAAAEVAEGGDYGESEFVFTDKNVPIVKIGDSLPVTDEQLEDVAMMGGYINSRLTFGVRQRFDRQVLLGNGTAPNMRGLKNVSGIQTQARGVDPVPDAFHKAMTKILVTGRAIPTHHVMHPTDWQDVRLLRTADGVYIWGAPSDAGQARMWGLPVAMADADTAGTGYTGSFQPAWVAGFERRGVDVQVGYVGSQFTQGKRTVRADMRAVTVWRRPAAFCEVTNL